MAEINIMGGVDSNQKKTYILYGIIILCIITVFGMGIYIYNNGSANAEYGAINERLRQIDSNIKSEFGNLNKTIDRGGKETVGTRIIVEGVRQQVESDRVPRGELQITNNKLKDALREIRSQKQETGVGK